MRVSLHLEYERRFDHGHGCRITGKDIGHPEFLFLDYGGVDDGVQLVEASAGERHLGKAGTIETAVGVDYFRAEAADDLVVHRVSRLHESTAQRVGFNDVGSEFAQHRSHRTFATAETAGKTHA